MTKPQDTKNSKNIRLQELEQENGLLLMQIHQLEEELEHYFQKNQQLEKKQAGESGNGVLEIRWVDDDLPEVMAENQRLQALVDVLRKKHELETEKALNIMLGNVLIDGTNHPGTLVSVPVKLLKIWSASSNKRPPKSLGGNGFTKVIEAYGDGGFEAVGTLMTKDLSPVIQANAYTALARHLTTEDKAAVAQAARMAYEIDPQPYRLKWLTFKLYEAGNLVEAEAVLDVLPSHLKFSDSETRKANLLRQEVQAYRQQEANRISQLYENREQVHSHIEALSLELRDTRTEKETLSSALDDEKEENELILLQLYQAQEELESQYSKGQELEQKIEELHSLVVEQKTQIEQLNRDKDKIEGNHSRDIKSFRDSEGKLKKENDLLLFESKELHEKLEKQYSTRQTLEQKIQELKEQKDVLLNVSSDKTEQLEKLRQEKKTVEFRLANELEAVKKTLRSMEQEILDLTGQKDELSLVTSAQTTELEKLSQEKKAVESDLQQIIEDLKQTLDKVEQEKLAIIEEKNELLKMSADRAEQIENLRQEKLSVESDLQRELGILKQTLTKVDQEKLELVEQKKDLERVEQKLLDQLGEARQAASLSLKLQLLREADLKDLQARYKDSREKEEEQHKLLAKLGERLTTASAYFHEIANNGRQDLYHGEVESQSGRTRRVAGSSEDNK